MKFNTDPGDTPFTPALTAGDGQFQDRLIVLRCAYEDVQLSVVAHVARQQALELGIAQSAYDVQVNKMILILRTVRVEHDCHGNGVPHWCRMARCLA